MLNYYNELLYYVQRMTGDKENAKDVIQETYCKALEIDVRSNINNKRAYLYKMARNIVFDQVNKNKNVIKVEYEETSHTISSTEQPEEIIISQDQDAILKRIVNSLSPRSKQAFILYTIDGYSRKEIAEKMGISSNAVEKHITRATMKIQERLKEDRGYNDEIK